MDCLAVDCDSCIPDLVAAVEIEALVLRAGFSVYFLCVAVVLCAGGRAKVGLSIVQAVMVDVVDYVAVGDLQNLPVHVDWSSIFSRRGVALCIVSVSVFSQVPFVFIELLEIVRIDDCEFTL